MAGTQIPVATTLQVPPNRTYSLHTSSVITHDASHWNQSTNRIRPTNNHKPLLANLIVHLPPLHPRHQRNRTALLHKIVMKLHPAKIVHPRSEERRVGKECRSRRTQDQEKQR